MKKISITLTKRQINELEDATIGTINFGILAQPLICSGVMKVLILTEQEFETADKFFKKFIPKELKNKQQVAG